MTVSIRSAALAAFVLAAGSVAFAAPAAQAKSSYDGDWSVLIMTQKGDCDKGYRYPVRISNGAVGYSGEASFAVNGRVANNGAITVTVSKAGKSAHGTGTLNSAGGGGSWKAASGECSGTWTAERRS